MKVNIDPLLCLKHLLTLSETQLITLFKLSVVLIVLLNGVVCEMDKWLVNLLLV